MNHANFVVIADRPDRLVILDLGPWDQHPTITNDAEYVVEQLAPRLGNRLLLYVDSHESTDQLLVRDGKFAGFDHWIGEQY